MCSHHIHQLERAALEWVDKIYISLDLTWNYLNLRLGINPSYPNPVVTCKQPAAHISHTRSSIFQGLPCLTICHAFKIYFHIIPQSQ